MQSICALVINIVVVKVGFVMPFDRKAKMENWHKEMGINLGNLLTTISCRKAMVIYNT